MSAIVLKFLHNSDDETASKSNRIFHKNEIVRIDDTGLFKIGDGKSTFSELPYSNTIPEEVYFKDLDGIVEYRTPSELK